MKIDLEKFANCVEHLGKKQYAAAALEVTTRTLSNYLKGETQPNLQTLQRLARHCHCKVNDLVIDGGVGVATAIAESFIRVVDLRDTSKPQGIQIAWAHCSYDLSIQTPGKLPFYASTEGWGISFEHWWNSENLQLLGPFDQKPVPPLTFTKRIEFDCSTLSKKRIQIGYSIKFKHGFVGERGAFSRIHVDYQSREILVVFLFPIDNPCLEIGLKKREKPNSLADYVDAGIRPLFLFNRSIVVFLIGAAESGQAFLAEWKWDVGNGGE